MELMIDKVAAYLKAHSNVTGSDIGKAMGVQTWSISAALHSLKKQGLADYYHGKANRKIWSWGLVRKDTPKEPHKPINRAVKTRPISDINQQIKPAESLII